MDPVDPSEPGPDRPPAAPDRAGRPDLRESRYWPPNWPIRWKLTAVSAGLTFLILVIFGVVVGQLATNRLRDNFAADTMSKADELAEALPKIPNLIVSPAYIDDEAFEREIGPSAGRIDYWPAGGIITSLPLDEDPPMGPLHATSGVTTFNGFQIATAPVINPQNESQVAGWIRYGRSEDRLADSINSIRFSIMAGVLGATLLAALGAMVLSRRAMRPISVLTSTAREIARTRDPEVRLATPVSDDEVAELTRTFSEMLHELTLSRAEEERLLRRQREFVADASHELRTPLTSVLANLELLEDSLRQADRNDDVDAVESALRSSRRMRRLVADLQVLARIDALREAAFDGCDLERIAADAVAELEPLIDQQTIEVKSTGPVPVQGAADELHRVAVNLIGNAIRHVGGRSRIIVATTADQAGGTAILTVSDDGPGIPAAIKPEIFDRFVRGVGPLDRAGGKGTGLGLAIVKAIAERHGGTVSVGDSPIGGAEFTVALPLATRNGSVDGGSQTGRKSLGEL
ncbi:MAG: HAMP domain-containing histidine kinase [Solirubrobacterales bacterium]|nr:HAMP domain-containing histidine kinase [Solirubrobacterales bacterium]